MPHFKHNITGNEVEVTEEFAEQVLRPQGKYEEFTPEALVKVQEAPRVSKKKTAKKKSR